MFLFFTKTKNLLPKQKRKKGNLFKQDALYAWLFILPQLGGLAIFLFYPFFSAAYLSFHRWNLLGIPQFIGFENFKAIFQDPIISKTLINTFYFTGGSLPLSIVGALFLAVLVNKPLKGISVFRAIFYSPVVATWVAVAFVWRYMFQPEMGIINYFLNLLGIEGPTWLNSTMWAMPSVIIVNVWKSIGYNMLLFLAGLQNIPDVFYEAADIDGANGWHKFKSITLPLLTPTFFFVIVTSIIFSLQAFTEVYIMTNGGPAYSTSVAVFYIQNLAFEQLKMGLACSIALILFSIILVFTLVQWKFSRYWVHYQV